MKTPGWTFSRCNVFGLRVGATGNPVGKSRCIYFINVDIYLEPVCPLFRGLDPPKEGPFQSKQGLFGFQVYTIYMDLI